MLAQRRRRWASVVKMLYNFFVFAGYSRFLNVLFADQITGIRNEMCV